MVYEIIPHINWVVVHPLYTLNNQWPINVIAMNFILAELLGSQQLQHQPWSLTNDGKLTIDNTYSEQYKAIMMYDVSLHY